MTTPHEINNVAKNLINKAIKEAQVATIHGDHMPITKELCLLEAIEFLQEAIKELHKLDDFSHLQKSSVRK